MRVKHSYLIFDKNLMFLPKCLHFLFMNIYKLDKGYLAKAEDIRVITMLSIYAKIRVEYWVI